MFLLLGITQFRYFFERDKRDDKNKVDSPSRTTNNSATRHVQNQLTPAILQTAAVILENPDMKQ